MNPAPSPQRWQNKTKAKAKAKAKLTPTFFSSLRLFYGGSCFTRTIWSILSRPMDHMPAKVLHDTDENRTRNEAAETSFSRNDVKDIPKPGPITPGVNRKVNVVDWRAQELVSPNTPIDEDRSGEVNMEASITPDDFIRAGGFGAKDDISSFLPVASD